MSGRVPRVARSCRVDAEPRQTGRQDTCESSDDRVPEWQVTVHASTPAPRQAAWQGSRHHRCATPGSQQQRCAFISRPACSTAFTRAGAFSGDMMLYAATDGLRCTDGAGDMYALCGGDADAWQCPTFHFHDGRVKATFRCGARLLLLYATAKPRRHLSRTTRSRGHATQVSPRSNSGVHEQEACPASRMLDFERSVRVSSALVVELTWTWTWRHMDIKTIRNVRTT